MSIKAGSLMGIPVRLDYTLVLAVVLIAWSLASGYMPAEYPGLSPREYWITGLLGAITLFTSVLVHELAHSYVAKSSGLPVERITLFIFGGVSEIKEEPKSPGQEFRITVVGPVSSFIIGTVLGSLWLLLNRVSFPPIVLAPLEYGSYINFMLGGFNMLPAFPLDGGRILRATLWSSKRSLVDATKIATRVGVLFSYLFIVAGLLTLLAGAFISGLWFMLIGWFLRNGAESSLQQTIVGESLAGVKIRDIMTSEIHAVEPDVLLSDLVNNYFFMYKHGGFPVAKDSNLLGLVTMQDVKKIPRERWREVRVVDVMTSCEKLACVDPDEKAIDALMKMSKQSVGRLPVWKDGKLMGIVSRSDVMKAIQMRTELQSARAK